MKSDVKKVKNVNPDAVDSQKEADEIAIAIQRSLEAAEKENDAQPKVKFISKRLHLLFDFPLKIVFI